MEEVCIRFTQKSGDSKTFTQSLNIAQDPMSLTLAIRTVQRQINEELSKLVDRDRNITAYNESNYSLNVEEAESDESDSDEGNSPK